jgi:hypothetical protein
MSRLPGGCLGSLYLPVYVMGCCPSLSKASVPLCTFTEREVEWKGPEHLPFFLVTWNSSGLVCITVLPNGMKVQGDRTAKECENVFIK